jgi:hypothetical protein
MVFAVCPLADSDSVCDIIPEGLLLVSEKFKLDAKFLLPVDISDIMSMLPQNMNALYIHLRSKVIDLLPPYHQNLMEPTELVLLYTEDDKLSNLINTIVSSLSVPLFLPITRHMIYESETENDYIDVAATTLAHAIQILLFAPTQWNRNIVYTRDSSEYIHRYPTPAGHGGNCRTVAGRYSLEDLHRSILLMYLAIYRRRQKYSDRDRAPPVSTRSLFLGYFDAPMQLSTPNGQSTWTYR